MKLKKAPRFYAGTSNIILPVPNKSYYPPEYQDKSRLQYYASLFNSVEINSSFYKLPMARTVERWATEVPPHFRFSFKLWREITHAKELHYDTSNIERFLQVVDKAGSKRGCLLIQFPASIKGSFLQKLKKLMDDITSFEMVSGWKLAVEFRDKSWHRDSVYQLLERYKASVVVHDMPASATPLIDMDTDLVYIRFHGEKGDYRGSYTSDFLEEYATNIKDWLHDKKYVYVYFNNSLGSAVQDLITLNSF